ncbi:MAG: carboxypeptidase regulatory-like domain-containing protein [Anaerolineae bacterium]|nr:carboxypeptidase regulatory-like domain-containing protein [Anaerolineae bacterium]
MKWQKILGLFSVLAMLLGMGALQGIPALAGALEGATNPRHETFPLRTALPAAGEPILLGPVEAAVFDGDLRDLPQLSDRPQSPPRELPVRPIPGWDGREARAAWVDPLAQTLVGAGRMPDPIMNFAGLDRNAGGGWTPPDTNGDVGPNHYVEGVNIAFAIYDKSTGAELVAMTFDELFDGTGTPCDNQNRGDIIVLYDPMADRWLLSDFSLPSSGPVYECLAISQTGDPVSGGWYFYALITDADGSPWHDYPKLGVWPDAYYMTANMFDPPVGAWIWALDRAAMLNGDPLNAVLFDHTAVGGYWSLLPANLRGPLPPAGAPNYLATVDFPNVFRIWEFHVDWLNPGDSTLTGPVNLAVADFDLISEIPQEPPGAMLDSLGDRPMMQLQYRNFGSHESIWVNHTVASGGVAGVRWYEIRDPGGSPAVYQQGTFQPDDGLYRWMGSLAVDQDGNMALGYSVSSEVTKPGIRYAGRLAGEPLGLLTQGEAELHQGTGVQTSSNRWGDYSAMTVDPLDDCTFWYTQEYYEVNGGNWNTRIGSFRFPSCGVPKGWISGLVYDADTMQGIPGVIVVAESLTTTFTAQTDANGNYAMTLPGSTYELIAGPLPPGYPFSTTIPGVGVTAGVTTLLDIPLLPYPNLVDDTTVVDDNVPGGNGNGYPEPGEAGLLLWEAISNTGTTTATNLIAHLVALSPGVTVTVGDASYPDIEEGGVQFNLAPFEFSVAPTVPCGARLDFVETITTDQGSFIVPFSLYAKVPLPREPLFFDDVESGEGDWVSGGYPDNWAITAEQAHSPSHAWSDSPYGNYADNASTWLRSPIFDLSGRAEVEIGFWHRYEIETGWDFGYFEYSLDGGNTWQDPLADYTGFQYAWVQEVFEAPFLADQPNVAFRYRLETDVYVNEDGWYIDDVEVTHEPYMCVFLQPDVPALIAPPDGTITTTHAVTFTWQPGGGGTSEGYNLELDGVAVTVTEPFSAAVLDAGVHTWRVQAFNAGGASGYTDLWTVEVVDPPLTPTLLLPPDGAVTTTHAVTFTWQPGAGGAPDGYNLDLDGAPVTVTVPFSAAVLEAGAHTWRVRAFNAAGYSDYTAGWTVTVVDPPGIPALLAPPSGTITTTTTITFVWEAGIGDAPDGYNLDVDGAVITTTEPFTVATLAGGLHTWRVRAFNAAGYSDYSAAWMIEIASYEVYLPVLLRE